MSKKIKCNFCGKIIIHSLVIADGDNYCSVQCLEDWTSLDKHNEHPGVKIRNECLERDHERYDEIKQKQKHDKVERMAWEYCNTNFENLKKMHNDNQSTIEHLHYCLECSWQLAEAFYNYAKEKEEGFNE